MSNVARECVAASGDTGNSDPNGVLPQESIQMELHQYTEDLRKNKMMAVGEINHALESLAFLVNYTSPIDYV